MAKKKPGKKHPNPVHKVYEVSGDSLKRKNRSCPKCGSATYMARHQGRWHCGKCAYTEFESKKKEAKESG